MILQWFDILFSGVLSYAVSSVPTGGGSALQNGIRSMLVASQPFCTLLKMLHNTVSYI